MKLTPTFSSSTKLRARLIGYGTIAGIIIGTAGTVYALPYYERASEYLASLGTVESINPHAYASTTVENETYNDIIERYTEEAFEANLQDYRDDARMKAIERMEVELEAAKQDLRANALFD